MKNLLLLPIVAISLMFICGCVRINSSDSGSMGLHPETIGPVDGYRPLYTVCEKNKVSAKSDVKCLFWIFTWGSDNAFADNATISSNGSLPLVILGKIFPFLNAKQTAAQAAFYKACKQNNCDSILAARYEITFEDYFFYKKMNVEVKGFPAKMTGLETVKPMPYYVDNTGKIVVLDKFVKPYLLFNHSKTAHQGFLAPSMGFLEKIF